MNISDYILDYLNRYGSVAIQDFGIFYFENAQAEVKPNENVILPPAKRVFFKKDDTVQGGKFLYYLEQKKQISPKNAAFELQTQVDFWKKKLNANDDFNIPNLGSFNKEKGNFIFNGKRIEKQSSDFFGLEPINYEVQKNSSKENPSKPKKTSVLKITFWILFLVILMLGGYFLYYYQNEVRVFLNDFDFQEKKQQIQDFFEPYFK